MAADGDDDMERLDYEELMQYPKSHEDIDEYKLPELKQGKDLRESEAAGVPVSGDFVPQHRHQPQVRVRGIARPVSLTRRNANSMIWKAMTTTIQGARSAFGAAGRRIGMSVSEMKGIYNHEEKPNKMKCPRSISMFAISCRRIWTNRSRPW